MAAETGDVAVGDDAAVADVEPGHEQIPIGAVLGAERGAVEADAGGLAHQVGAELLHEGALHDQHVGAEDLAGRDLAVGVGVCAGCVDDVALSLSVRLFKTLIDVERDVRCQKEQTLLVKVRHSLLGTPPISLKTSVLGPLTGPVGTMMTWAEARARKRARPEVNFILTT